MEKALAKHSADILGLPDYALYSGGGRVIHSLTSTSYNVPSKSIFARLVTKLVGLDALGLGNPPTTALNPDIHLGQCWPFPGDQGNLTISLSRDIIPSNFSIEHVPRSIAIDVKSAPKRIELLSYKNKLYEQQYLASYEYDIDGMHHIQTFPTQVQVNVSRPIRIVQLRVLSNYGQEAYTCLYRFRVHGTAAE
ncbi:hypothetical protein K493DRAFT_221077 [Basidiobolus meristosporus CBS 931.73]|uniref:SUN domain-containing protein n=1 Tax=Basidiobolus meristosporus CBS 931.73 TaxID=1314790 RepID=A0A1Y1Y9K4_9FUNG|nr:hypothetical protein K493DRAFT_221077 [Basidiobolus meristosporus CBS 931.73]|eukprot:ORX94575.1 hypothetical protein K493DRAFT_221077 [Basidiobolus meristosporus CBS 931.73]